MKELNNIRHLIISLQAYGNIRIDDSYLEELDSIKDKLKALEIIKRESQEVIEIITTYSTWKEYCEDYPISDKSIIHFIKSAQEFNLLKKEILKWSQRQVKVML